MMPEDQWPIYVVDDDESIRKALGRLLTSLGYRVFTFASAESLLDFSTLGLTGCYILDIKLPGMTGLELQKRLRGLGVEHKIIFITAHDIPQWREQAMQAGAIAYLGKPFDQDVLLQALGMVQFKTHSQYNKEVQSH